MKITKRGQAPIKSPTSYVAAFVLLLMLFILLFVFLLPEKEREELLNITQVTKEEVTEEEAEGVNILLSQSPGLLFPFEEKEEEHKISSVNLFSTVETETSTLANTLTVSRNIFQDKSQTLSFTVANLDNLEKVSLLFFVASGKGNLVLRLNNEIFYNAKVTSRDLPIELPKEHLEKENILEISASSPTWRILSSNSYILKDVRIIKKYKVENKKAERTFVLSSAEKGSLEKAKLNYFINCISLEEIGTLRILLNHQLQSIQMVHCDAGELTLEIEESALVSGRNLLEFEIDKGNYVIEQIELVTEFEKKFQPKYEFYIEEDQFKDIKDLEKDVKLKMEFGESAEKRKQATLIINGKRIYLDTTKDTYSEDISEMVEEGENYIKIIAKSEFEILKLRIILE